MKKNNRYRILRQSLFGGVLLLSISLFFPVVALSQIDTTSIASDGFESKTFDGGTGWLGSWDKQGNVVLVKKLPYEGKRYVKLMGGKAAGVLERSVDLSTFTSVRLKFTSRVKSFENNDQAYVKVSSDGKNYTTIQSFTPADSDNQYRVFDLDLSGFTMSSDFRIVFEAAMGRKKTDMWFIDSIEVVGDSDPGPVDKTFTVTAVRDNLDNNDLYIMADRLAALGYGQRVLDTDVTSSELISYLQRDTTTLYHTGHGSNGSVMTANGSINYRSTTVNVRNTIWATCLTLTQTGWRDAFGPTADTISGYTKVSYDNIDDTVVKTFAKEIGKGKSYPVAWYLANNGINSLSDRWCIYARQNGNIVEYSARNNTIPSDDSGTFVQIDQAGKVKASQELLRTGLRYRNSFDTMRAEPAEAVSKVESSGFAMLKQTNLSEADAITTAEAYLDDQGELSADMMLDSVYAIQSRISDNEPYKVVGWAIRFTQQTETGLLVRGNSVEPHKTVVVTQAGQVMALSKYWPEMTMIQKTASNDLIDAAEALQKAAEAISDRVKQGVLEIVHVEPVYGIGGPSVHSQELAPAYGFATSDNVVIVVDARTGELLF